MLQAPPPIGRDRTMDRRAPGRLPHPSRTSARAVSPALPLGQGRGESHLFGSPSRGTLPRLLLAPSAAWWTTADACCAPLQNARSHKADFMSPVDGPPPRRPEKAFSPFPRVPPRMEGPPAPAHSCHMCLVLSLTKAPQLHPTHPHPLPHPRHRVQTYAGARTMGASEWRLPHGAGSASPTPGSVPTWRRPSGRRGPW
jgi:hypothetical protein